MRYLALALLVACGSDPTPRTHYKVSDRAAPLFGAVFTLTGSPPTHIDLLGYQLLELPTSTLVPGTWSGQKCGRIFEFSASAACAGGGCDLAPESAGYRFEGRAVPGSLRIVAMMLVPGGKVQVVQVGCQAGCDVASGILEQVAAPADLVVPSVPPCAADGGA